MPILLLALVLLVGGGALIAATALSTRSRGAIVHDRVGSVAQGAAKSEGDASEVDLAGRAEQVLKAFYTLGRARWGATVSGWLLLAFGVAAAGLISFAGGVVLRWPGAVVLLSAALAFYFTPRMVIATQQSRAERAFVDRFPDAIDMINRMLRAGLPVTAAVRTVGTDAAAPVKAVFAKLADQVEIGIPLDEALLASAVDIRLPDYRFFAVAVSLQHSTGGNLAATLDTLAEIIRRRRVMRLKARAVTSEVRTTAYVLGAIPFVIAAGMLIIDPAYLLPMVADPRGQLLAATALASLGVGFFAIHQMLRSVTAK